jgi:hypothetical protein
VSAAPDTLQSASRLAVLPLVLLRRHGLTAGVAVLVFWLAWDGGTYALTDRSTLAIGVWWAVIVSAGLGLWPRADIPRSAVATGGLLAGFAAWTGASAAWAASAEDVLTEVNRASLYLAVFVAVVLAARRSSAGRWADGLAVGLAGVAVVALASRLFPDLFPARAVPQFLPDSEARLSFPVDYWNGLAILIALGCPLVLRLAVVGRGARTRGPALAVLPVLSAVIFLSSSRGGFLTAFAAIVAFVLLTERRVQTLAAALLGTAGSALAIAVLSARPDLVDGPLGTDAAASQGRSAALLILGVCAACGGAWALGSRLAPERLELRPALVRLLAVVAVVLAVAGVVAADPSRRLEEFKQTPSQADLSPEGFTGTHLLSGAGSGRWQFWTAAVDEFRSAPLVGQGAGSFESWWAEHGSFSYFLRDAHSLYLEVLGELGLVGFVLLVGALGLGLAAGIRRVRSATGADRITLAAIAACLIGFLLAAGIDWMWELTVVAAVGIACLALLTGPAGDVAGSAGERSLDSRLFGSRAVVLVAAWLLVCAQAIPLLAALKIRESEEAAGRGATRDALSDALAAKSLEPWASAPYLQLALVAEEAGDLGSARRWIGEAIERDRVNWRLWLVSARVETKAGSIVAARRDLAEARRLNPRSPLFER